MLKPTFLENTDMLRIGGAVVAVFSVVMGLLVLFVIPSACSFLTSLELLILGLLFIGGITAWLLGQIFAKRRRRI